MASATETEVVRWAQENREYLAQEYARFTEQTNVRIPFDNFCICAFEQMPHTSQEGTE